MAWTKKISSVIKGRINSGASSAKGFIDNMAGNLTGEIDKFTSAFSGVADINAAKAKAKNIINSSFFLLDNFSLHKINCKMIL